MLAKGKEERRANERERKRERYLVEIIIPVPCLLCDLSSARRRRRRRSSDRMHTLRYIGKRKDSQEISREKLCTDDRPTTFAF